jgi:hypothetical protein
MELSQRNHGNHGTIKLLTDGSMSSSIYQSKESLHRDADTIE